MIEVALVALALGATAALDRRWFLEPFAFVLVAYGFFAFGTLLVLRGVRALVPLAPGVYTVETHPRVLLAWRVFNYLAMNNLFFHYQNGLLPSHMRKFFSRWLGMKAGGGIISIAGVVVDPDLITLEEDTMVGQDASLLPSSYENGRLTLGRITVRRGAVVGARSVVLPGVTLGRGSMVKAMSVVAAGTVVGDGEVWGGVPARKMGQNPPDGGENRFSSWRDLVVSGGVETALLAGGRRGGLGRDPSVVPGAL
jgi:acetyltransferase-like isoleucine patch superfamily enzyme